ncbi:MAG: hypothetical protein ACT4P3_19855 [Betaproteobacteria bacterium]
MLALAAGCAAPPPTPDKQDFDKLIVPAVRIGPVAPGGYVDEVVKKLGEPDRTRLNTRRGGPGFDADSYIHVYNRYCINFPWFDKGLRPTIAYGFWGVNATCNRWKTEKGISVGSTIAEVIAAYGEPNKASGCGASDDDCVLMYNSGIWFRARDRRSPIREINIVPAQDYSKM